jgi:hypothetical protein
MGFLSRSFQPCTEPLPVPPFGFDTGKLEDPPQHLFRVIGQLRELDGQLSIIRDEGPQVLVAMV